MEQLYKSHRIEVLAGLEGADWVTWLRVFSQKGAAHTLMILAMNEHFATYDQAIDLRLGIGLMLLSSGIQRPLRCAYTPGDFGKRPVPFNRLCSVQSLRAKKYLLNL